MNECVYSVELSCYGDGEFVVCLKRKTPKAIRTVCSYIERNRFDADERASALSRNWFDAQIADRTTITS